MAQRKLVIFLFLLFCFSFVSSLEGYDLRINEQSVIKQNQDFTFSVRVFNISNGVPITNVSTSCYFNLYNSSGFSLVQKQMNYDPNNVQNEWNYKVFRGNFSYIGIYSYIIQCNSSSLGGTEGKEITTTGTGSELKTSNALIYASLLFLIIVVFLIILFGIVKLPSKDEENEEGQLISINSLKYFRSVLLFVEWILIISIFYLTSNIAFAYLGEQLFAKLFFTFYKISFSLTPLIIIVWFLWIFYSLFKDNKLKKMLEKGIYPTGKF